MKVLYLIKDALPEGVQETQALVVVVWGLGDAIQQIERFLPARGLLLTIYSSASASASASAHCSSLVRW